MINLLPPKAKKFAKIEYSLRVGSTFCFLFGALILFIAVAHIPTYVLLDVQIHSLNEANATNQDRDEAIRNAENTASEAKSLVSQLQKLHKGELNSKVISEIRKANPGRISYKQFTINADEQGVIEEVLVQGISPTRSELAQYKVSLEENPLFESAEVPISDLARDADLPFVITIFLNQEV